MHDHAGAQTASHTPISTFLLAAEQMLNNAIRETYARDGHSPFKDELVEIGHKVYELRLREIER